MRTRRFGNSFTLFIATLLSLIAGWSRVGAADPASGDVTRGRHIATALTGCADCHGASFAGGRAFTRSGVTVYTANLTPGRGGITGYSDDDLRRAIRAGVRPDGTTLRVMPINEFAPMTDRDVDDVIAFLHSLPPIDNIVPRTSVVPPASPSALPAAPPSTDQPEMLGGGAYLVTIGGCRSCHGANLTGGIRPGGLVAPNISRTGIGSWTFADFQTAMRSGKTPLGRMLSAAMPWARVGHMTDDELRAVYDYLESDHARSG